MRTKQLVWVTVLLFVVVACRPSPTPLPPATSTPAASTVVATPSATTAPTVLAATQTPRPSETATPEPTATAAATQIPTWTPRPTHTSSPPTATPIAVAGVHGPGFAAYDKKTVSLPAAYEGYALPVDLAVCLSMATAEALRLNL